MVESDGGCLLISILACAAPVHAKRRECPGHFLLPPGDERLYSTKSQEGLEVSYLWLHFKLGQPLSIVIVLLLLRCNFSCTATVPRRWCCWYFHLLKTYSWDHTQTHSLRHKHVCAYLSIYLCVSNKQVGEEATALARGSSPPAATVKNHCGGHCNTAEPLKQQHAYRETLEWCACWIAKTVLRLEALCVS